MRVLITRPEREAMALAETLGARDHEGVIASLFKLEFLPAPEGFEATLAGCQAIVLTSANGARALARVSEERAKAVLAVGDTTATTAQGLGFTSVTSASGDSGALAELIQQRFDPKAGPLVHISGIDVTDGLAPRGFEVRRFALYDAHAVDALPDVARTALEACTVDAVTFFSPRASTLFARLVEAAGLAAACRSLSAVVISRAAAEPLIALPFKTTVVAVRPTRQAMLDEIDRLAAGGVKGPEPMPDTPSASPPPPAPPARRGAGLVSAFIMGLLAAVLLLAGAVLSLPYWPEEARQAWRGPPPPAPPPPPDVAGPVDTAKREIEAKLEDLDKRVRAATAAAQADRPPDPAIAELRGRLTGLEGRVAAAAAAPPPRPGAAPAPAPAPAAPAPPAAQALAALEKELAQIKQDLSTLRQDATGLRQETATFKQDEAALKQDMTGLRAAMTALEQLVEGQREALEKAKGEASKRSVAEQQTALAAARASAAIGIAARLSSAVQSGLPYVQDLELLAPFAKDDPRLAEAVTALQPQAAGGVTSRAVLMADFPAVAKAALADDLADDSFGQRLLGKLRSLVSLRRVGADVEGTSAEAQLARAEAALEAGNLAQTVELVKALPTQTKRATASWLSRAETHLGAQRAVDRLAAHAVTLLGAARTP